MARTAVIFPGQGAQQIGMGKDVVERSVKARAIYEKADGILGFELSKLCFEGPAEELEKTDIQQPAIFVTSVAIWEAYIEAGGDQALFTHSGGLSLGEYSALHIAGAMGFEEALRLVRRRGQLMQEAAVASPSGMVSLIGANEEGARSLCDNVRGGDVLAPANFNCPGQVVVSGSKSACERAVETAGESGYRAVALAVAGAFHSPLMAPAAAGLEPVLNETAFRKARIPVAANVNGDYHASPEHMREWLKRQVTEPVLWQQCIERMIADGVDRFVEMGPGRVLTGLMRKINRKMETLCVNSIDSLNEAIEKLKA